MSTEEKLKHLEYQRRNYKGSLTRVEKYIAESLKNEASADVFEVTSRLTMLSGMRTTFDSVQLELELLDEDELGKKEREEFEERYIKAEAALNRLKHKLQMQDEISLGAILNESSRPSHVTRVNITKSDVTPLDPPKFDGSYLSWTSFINTFDSIVHSDQQLSEVQKLNHLKKSVGEGQGAQVIGHLELIPKNYNVARTLLIERFSKKRMIFEAYVRKLLNIAHASNGKGLRVMLDQFTSCMSQIESLEATDDDLAQGILIAIALQKVDKKSLEKWEEYSASQPQDLPECTDFLSFMSKRCDIMEQTDFAANSNFPTSTPSPKKACMLVQSPEPSTYIFCERSCTSLTLCPKFLSLKTKKRFFKARDLDVCRRCLIPGHHRNKCKKTCSKCNKDHHDLLHWSNDDAQHQANVNCTFSHAANMLNAPNGPIDNNGQLHEPRSIAETNSCAAELTQSYGILGTAIVKFLDNAGNEKSLRVLVDTGAQLNLITQKALSGLLPRLFKVNVATTDVHGHSKVQNRGIELRFLSSFCNFGGLFHALVVPKIGSQHPSVPLDRDSCQIPRNIELADPLFQIPRDVDVLFGTEYAYRILGQEQIYRGPNLPLLQKSLLGWLVVGKIPKTLTANSLVLTASTQVLERFWEIDEMPKSKLLSPDEERIERKFLDTVTVTEAGKYQVDLLFKHDPQVLGKSFHAALKCLMAVEKSFERKPDVQKQYSDFMAEYEALGHMEEVAWDPEAYNFLNHHAVLKESSTTTKLRVVFNASKPTSSGVSLNDCLEVGPKIQADIFDILVKFRGFAVGISGDIEKMYRQVEVLPEQRKYQTILWRRPGSPKISMFQLKTITYGTGSASYLAVRCLYDLAKKNPQLPLAAKVILTDFYMDDAITGAENAEKAIEIYQEIATLLGKAGMRIRKWCSNSTKFLESVPKEDQDTLVRIGEEEFTKTLGLRWETNCDNFLFIHEAPAVVKKWTLRSVTSTMAKVFDPLGLICPVVVKMKIMIQRLWILKLNWDEPLPLAETTAWHDFMLEMPSLSEIRIPRFVGGLGNGRRHYELWGFADASMKCYGAVVYVRTICEDGLISVRMVAAKARVAPLKKKSLARLELLGAIVLAEMLERLVKDLPFDIQQSHCCLDSRVALTWVTSAPHNYDIFVANRVSYIQEMQQPLENGPKLYSWHHVPGKRNPADIVSRGLLPKELVDTPYWINGPDFLHEAKVELHVPEPLDPSDERLELAKQKFVFTLAISDDPVERAAAQGNLIRLKKLFFFLQRIIAVKKKEDVAPINRKDKLSAIQLDEGLRFAIRVNQHYHFEETLSLLKKGTPLPQSHSLAKLKPFLDKEGTLRVGGKLRKSPIPFDAKYPMILPRNGALSQLIVKMLHEDNNHAGPQAIMAFVRQRFWIIGGKQLVTKCFRCCIRCIRSKPITFKHVMGDLPEDRTKLYERPFTVCGLDLFGPLFMRQKGRGSPRLKVYVALFVCFAVKACHLELVEDLTTSALLNALNRFVNRRGTPTTIWSDNGTNLQGASELLKNLDWTLVDKWAREHKQLDWKHIPARSPHFGGLWESSIKQAKHSFLKVVGDDPLFRDELETLLTSIEATLNSRPLIPLSISPVDDYPLTPAHFLIGAPMIALPDPTLIKPNPAQKKMIEHWKHFVQIREYWLQRFLEEFLQTLQNRYKWTKQGRTIVLDSAVLMVDKNLSAWQWSIARISKLFPGSDGVVRVVEVTTSSGSIFRRAVDELIPIPHEN